MGETWFIRGRAGAENCAARFQDSAARIWVSGGSGANLSIPLKWPLSAGQTLPLVRFPGRSRGQGGKRVDQPRGWLFHLDRRRFRRADRLDDPWAEGFRSRSAARAARGRPVAWLSLRVAWHISKTGKFADRNSTRMGWAKGRVEALYFEATAPGLTPTARWAATEAG